MLYGPVTQLPVILSCAKLQLPADFLDHCPTALVCPLTFLLTPTYFACLRVHLFGCLIVSFFLSIDCLQLEKDVSDMRAARAKAKAYAQRGSSKKQYQGGVVIEELEDEDDEDAGGWRQADAAHPELE